MRGKNMYLNVRDTDQKPQKKKGRNKALIEQRNQCIIDRYYYYGAYTDKRYDLAMDQMTQEFFLSPSTITDIIDLNKSALNQLKTEKPPISVFQAKWGWLKW